MLTFSSFKSERVNNFTLIKNIKTKQKEIQRMHEVIFTIFVVLDGVVDFDSFIMYVPWNGIVYHRVELPLTSALT